MGSPPEHAEQHQREDHQLQRGTYGVGAFLRGHGSTTDGSGEENLAKLWQEVGDDRRPAPDDRWVEPDHRIEIHMQTPVWTQRDRGAMRFEKK